MSAYARPMLRRVEWVLVVSGLVLASWLIVVGFGYAVYRILT